MDRTNRRVLIILGVLVLAILLGPLLMGGMMGPGSFWGPGMMWGNASEGAPATGGWRWGLAMGLGGLMMLAFWGAIIAGSILLVRWLWTASTQSGGADRETALEILQRRYAAGEITRAEYEQMRRDLEL
jgi:putative membrane protein